MRFFDPHFDFNAFWDVGGAPKTAGNPHADGFLGGKRPGADRFGRFRRQETLDFTVFVARPEQGGHAARGGRFRGIGKAVDAAENPDPLAVFDVVEVDAVDVSGFDGLGGGEASVLPLGQFPEIVRRLSALRTSRVPQCCGSAYQADIPIAHRQQERCRA